MNLLHAPQGNETVQRRIGGAGGIDTLLQCVAMYKSRDPATAEEEEFMQNCFDLLCTCLMIQENKVAFVKARGCGRMGCLTKQRRRREGGPCPLCFSQARLMPATHYAPFSPTPLTRLPTPQSEGVELVWIMLQSKKQSRYGAVKLLDFATTRFTAPCDKLVDLGGLKHLFGIFMGKARIKGPRGEGGQWTAM